MKAPNYAELATKIAGSEWTIATADVETDEKPTRAMLNYRTRHGWETAARLPIEPNSDAKAVEKQVAEHRQELEKALRGVKPAKAAKLSADDLSVDEQVMPGGRLESPAKRGRGRPRKNP